MCIRKYSLKATALILSILALSTTSEMFAGGQTCGKRGHDRCDGRVEAAQANYQDENVFVPVANEPIPFL